MTTSTVSSLCARYIKHAKMVEGKSPTTIKSYQNRLNIFCAWLSPNATLSDVSLATMSDYLYHVSSKGICRTTVTGYIHPLRAFGEWLVREGYWANNIAKSIQMPKRSSPERRHVSDQTVEAVLDAAHRLYPQKRSALAVLIVRLLVYTGVRRSELLAIRNCDIDMPGQSITIPHGKGDKPRTVGIHPDVASALKTWMKFKRHCTSPYLLTIDSARRLGQYGLKHLLQEVCKVAGVENITCHPLRRNYATYSAHVANIPVPTIQASMGHSRITTTEGYLRDKPKEVIDRMRNQPSRQQGQAPRQRVAVRRSGA